MGGGGSVPEVVKGRVVARYHCATTKLKVTHSDSTITRELEMSYSLLKIDQKSIF